MNPAQREFIITDLRAYLYEYSSEGGPRRGHPNGLFGGALSAGWRSRRHRSRCLTDDEATPRLWLKPACNSRPIIEIDVDRVTIDVQSSSSILFVGGLVGNKDEAHDPRTARSSLGA